MQPASDLFAFYRQAEAELSAGNLQQSADLCKQLLATAPDFAQGHFLMASLFRAVGHLDKALQFNESAIGLDAAVPAFYLQQGQVYFSLGKHEQALRAFRKASALEPANALYVVLAADVCVEQGHHDEAKRLFARARSIDDIAEIDEHEGLFLQRLGETDRAEALFDRLIARRPTYEWGYVHKGKILLEKQNHAQAEQYFTRALAHDPHSYEAALGMALVLHARSDITGAIRWGLQALQANPRGGEVLLLLSMLTFHHSQDYPMVENILRQTLAVYPKHRLILQMLVGTLICQKKTQAALDCVALAFADGIDSPELQYFQAMLTGQNIASPPKEYIANLFDAFAERFDQHLIQALDYCAPALLAQAIAGRSDFAGRSDLSLLDLGCGTGLVAAELMHMTGERIGVDLSEKMLEQARRKNLYSELHVQDIVEFCQATDRRFDLVLASDVLIYVGDLNSLFAAVRRAMNAGSLFAFTVEKADAQKSFALNLTGRYSHAPAYIEEMAAAHGYRLALMQDISLRKENAQLVPGMICLLQKSATH